MPKRIAVIGLYGMSALFSLERLPQTGETVRSDGLIFEPGGKGYNQAIGALHAGADVFFATAVGDDAYGCDAETIFKRNGIPRYLCMHMDDVATAFAVVAADASGNNIVMVEQGACARVMPDGIDALESEISECEVLLLQCEMPQAAIHRTLELGKKHSLYTILNPAPAKELSPDLLALVDLLTPNWGEAVSIAGINAGPEEVSQKLLDMGCKNVIITMGEDGSYVRRQGKTGYHQSACTVTCIDSTGAGDNFNGALAAQLLRGESLEDSVRYATVSSALSVTRRGVLAAVPTEADVKEYLRG